MNVNIYGHIINLYPSNPTLWKLIGGLFFWSNLSFSIFISFYISSFLYSFLSRQHIHKTYIKPQSQLCLLVGKEVDTNSNVYINENGLYQNILITGSIGSGKTSCAMYPFTEQLISFSSTDSNKKIGMLVLDVKGNYSNMVCSSAKNNKRQDDIILIELNGKYKYNPLDKPNLKPSVLANQLKNILLLFSPNNTESYWLDKSESVLSEAIKLCRIYNSNYVNFEELHNLITKQDYYIDKVNSIRASFLNNHFSEKDIYDLLSALKFFDKEFFSLDSRTLNILKSEITRITGCFVNDFDVRNTFSPTKEYLNFNGFKEVIKQGKIVVLNMNISKYRNLSRILAAYLKLDFQTEVMSTLSSAEGTIRTTAFISDEYSEYVTASDANFFSQSREAKCINIISTQSYTSLLNALSNQNTVKVITQGLINKLWFRTDDILTIEDAQKQLRKRRKRNVIKNNI